MNAEPCGESVTLTWREVRLAALAGIDLQIQHLYRGSGPGYAFDHPDRGWQTKIEGMLGEFVIAKLFDRYWQTGTPIERRNDGDVAGLEVRATRHTGGGLTVQRHDSDDAYFVLVVGYPPTFRVAGWLQGIDAKVPNWWRTDLPRPCYLIPQSSLRPLDELTKHKQGGTR